jgi:hypothetical protein
MTFGMSSTFHAIADRGNAGSEIFTVRPPGGHLDDVAAFGLRVP